MLSFFSEKHFQDLSISRSFKARYFDVEEFNTESTSNNDFSVLHNTPDKKTYVKVKMRIINKK